MNIVVLDGFALNPGDLSWTALESLGACRIHDRTAPADLLARAADADVLITNKTVLNRETIERLPRLKYVGVLATGYNVVDVDAARARKIPVSNIPAYGTRSVAQTVFAILLELTHHAGHHAQTVRAGRWSANPDWCYWDHPLIELDGLTFGVVGFGRIGQAVAARASAFGMRVAYTSRRQVSGVAGEWMSLDRLLVTSDVVKIGRAHV